MLGTSLDPRATKTDGRLSPPPVAPGPLPRLTPPPKPPAPIAKAPVPRSAVAALPPPVSRPPVVPPRAKPVLELVDLDLTEDVEPADEKTTVYSLDAVATLKLPAVSGDAPLPAAHVELPIALMLPPALAVEDRHSTTERPVASDIDPPIVFPRSPRALDESDLVPTEALAAQPADSDRRKIGWVAMGALGVVFASALLLTGPRGGSVVVAAKHSGAAITAGTVSIDGREVCASLPCRAPEIAVGARAVRIQVPGYRQDIELVAVRPGEDAAVTFELAREAPLTPVAVAQPPIAIAPPTAAPVPIEEVPRARIEPASVPAALPPKTEASAASTKKAPVATGTLSIDSSPPSRCVLDGRPVGATPKIGVRVSAGVHSVVCLIPGVGRKAASVRVAAGEARSVALSIRLRGVAET